jgi:hypothetical protein
MCVCVCVCVCVCARARVGVHACACAKMTRACACVRVALNVQYSTLHHIVICGHSESTTFFRHCLTNGTILGKKIIVEHERFTLILPTTFV